VKVASYYHFSLNVISGTTLCIICITGHQNRSCKTTKKSLT